VKQDVNGNLGRHILHFAGPSQESFRTMLDWAEGKCAISYLSSM
jgi:hypothetical protein